MTKREELGTIIAQFVARECLVTNFERAGLDPNSPAIEAAVEMVTAGHETFVVVNALLDALMEPSEAMLANAAGTGNSTNALLAKAIWQAMLRAAKE